MGTVSSCFIQELLVLGLLLRMATSATTFRRHRGRWRLEHVATVWWLIAARREDFVGARQLRALVAGLGSSWLFVLWNGRF